MNDGGRERNEREREIERKMRDTDAKPRSVKISRTRAHWMAASNTPTRIMRMHSTGTYMPFTPTVSAALRESERGSSARSPRGREKRREREGGR